MHPTYGALYLTWSLAWLGMELAIRYAPGWAWIALFLAFLVVELIGVRRPKPGDTFSEGVWKFIAGGRRARRWMGYALAVALGLRFVSLPWLLRGESPHLLEWGPVAALGVGLTLWLVDHFPNLGENG